MVFPTIMAALLPSNQLCWKGL